MYLSNEKKNGMKFRSCLITVLVLCFQKLAFKGGKKKKKKTIYCVFKVKTRLVS